MMKPRAYALVATVMLSLAFVQPTAAPAAFSGRNGDVLYAKQLDKGRSVRPFDPGSRAALPGA